MDYSVRTGNAFGALMKDPNAGKAKKKRNRKKKKKSKVDPPISSQYPCSHPKTSMHIPCAYGRYVCLPPKQCEQTRDMCIVLAKEAHAAVQTTPRGDEKIAESEPEEIKLQD
eukprot:1322870-Amorphochlora_amoeboformis.AAC.2